MERYTQSTLGIAQGFGAGEARRSALATAARYCCGGHFVDLASHTLNLIDYLVGPIIAAEGRSSDRGGLYEVEDLVSGFYHTEDGIHGSGQWGYTVGVEEDINEIIGSTGKLVFSTFGELPVVLQRGDDVQTWEVPHPTLYSSP